MSDDVRTVVIQLPEELPRVYPVVKELRLSLEFEDFARLVMLAHAADGYRIVTRERRDQVLAVMGYRILHDLVHGSHIYIDDLVTTKEQRSQGHGAELLKWAEAEARRLGLAGLRLCTGIENEEAKRFYDREGWQGRAIAFKKKVPKH